MQYKSKTKKSCLPCRSKGYCKFCGEPCRECRAKLPEKIKQKQNNRQTVEGWEEKTYEEIAFIIVDLMVAEAKPQNLDTGKWQDQIMKVIRKVRKQAREETIEEVRNVFNEYFEEKVK